MSKKSNIIDIMDDLRDSVTVSEVAEACKVNRITVMRWLQRGYLHGIQPPSKGPWRINKAGFLDFLANYRPATTRKEGEEGGDQKEGAGKVQSQR